MTAAKPAMVRFLSQLRAIAARTQEARVIAARVSPIVRDFALSKTWLEAKHYDCNVEQGFGAHLLHEEPDHTLAIFAGSWLPGRGAPTAQPRDMGGRRWRRRRGKKHILGAGG